MAPSAMPSAETLARTQKRCPKCHTVRPMSDYLNMKGAKSLTQDCIDCREEKYARRIVRRNKDNPAHAPHLSLLTSVGRPSGSGSVKRPGGAARIVIKKSHRPNIPGGDSIDESLAELTQYTDEYLRSLRQREIADEIAHRVKRGMDVSDIYMDLDKDSTDADDDTIDVDDEDSNSSVEVTGERRAVTGERRAVTGERRAVTGERRAVTGERRAGEPCDDLESFTKQCCDGDALTARYLWNAVDSTERKKRAEWVRHYFTFCSKNFGVKQPMPAKEMWVARWAAQILHDTSNYKMAHSATLDLRSWHVDCGLPLTAFSDRVSRMLVGGKNVHNDDEPVNMGEYMARIAVAKAASEPKVNRKPLSTPRAHGANSSDGSDASSTSSSDSGEDSVAPAHSIAATVGPSTTMTIDITAASAAVEPVTSPQAAKPATHASTANASQSTMAILTPTTRVTPPASTQPTFLPMTGVSIAPVSVPSQATRVASPSADGLATAPAATTADASEAVPASTTDSANTTASAAPIRFTFPTQIAAPSNPAPIVVPSNPSPIAVLSHPAPIASASSAPVSIAMPSNSAPDADAPDPTSSPPSS